MAPASIGALVQSTRKTLAAAAIDSAGLEARLLVGAACGIAPEHVLGRDHDLANEHQASLLEQMLRRRLAREPLAYILGRREFWSRDFLVSPAVLIPRPESETLIEAAQKFFADSAAPLRIADLGTGSGCLLLSLLALYPNARGTGLDASPAALAMAQANARAHGLADRCRLIEGFWPALDGVYDLIVSNPPYIASGDIAGLAPEVAGYEPRLALDGGGDGLAAYRAIAPLLADRLAPGGFAALEVGAGQAQAVGEILKANKMENIQFFHDLAGIDRVVAGCRKPRN